MNFVNGQTPHAPTVTSDAPGDAYCLYAGVSGASGGFELDALVGSDLNDATNRFSVMSVALVGDVPPQTASVANCQTCEVNANVDGVYGAIVGQNGLFTFTISGPADNQVRLETLAALVLDRSQVLR